jgi:hypothetical protein
MCKPNCEKKPELSAGWLERVGTNYKERQVTVMEDPKYLVERIINST